MYFVGYPSGQKGFKLFNIETQTYHVSRDVYFYEHVFSYSQPISSASSCPLPLGFDPMDATVPFPAPSPMHSTSSLPSSPTTTQFLPTPAPAPPSTSSAALQLSSAVNPPLRKTTRTITKPQWLNDFVCHTASSVPTVHHLTPAYACFVASLSTLQEPRTYKQAAQHQEWVDAMQQEILALEKNHTWDVPPLPPGKHLIGRKWVSSLK
ncbi:UNVERIFIED_CONTAM: hypothetical protein Slati_0210900 [Sesamum latifolium]|uniref:Retroviral polymerase SH3-like domain-containing protein n=1 Tax=Sesamum latifolium TaxID=2727402 RepID=A0AAW2YBT8_9LAMI